LQLAGVMVSGIPLKSGQGGESANCQKGSWNYYSNDSEL
jgi:hypothetical protein